MSCEPQLLAGVDAAYTGVYARAACVIFAGWQASQAEHTEIAVLPAAAEYLPGAFYKRELPVLLAVLKKVTRPVAAIIIDGYVWLDRGCKPGLGALLHSAL